MIALLFRSLLVFWLIVILIMYSLARIIELIAEYIEERRKRHKSLIFSSIPGMSILQEGRTVYVYIDNGRKYAVVTLDSDRPLTQEETQQILEDVKKIHYGQTEDGQ